MLDQKTPIVEFIKATAGRTPTPGGGSITALAGAMAAATGEMVIQYSLGRKSLEAYQDELRPALTEFSRARAMFLQLMEEDQLAYETMSSLQKLPAESAERRDKLPAAVLASIRVPQAAGAAAVALLELCDKMVNFVNHHLLSDLAVCADLAMATVRCAQYNARANLSFVEAESDRESINQANNRLLSRAASLIQRLSPRIWARQA